MPWLQTPTSHGEPPVQGVAASGSGATPEGRHSPALRSRSAQRIEVGQSVRDEHGTTQALLRQRVASAGHVLGVVHIGVQ